jgi:hypothetical protein
MGDAGKIAPHLGCQCPKPLLLRALLVGAHFCWPPYWQVGSAPPIGGAGARGLDLEHGRNPGEKAENLGWNALARWPGAAGPLASKRRAQGWQTAPTWEVRAGPEASARADFPGGFLLWISRGFLWGDSE